MLMYKQLKILILSITLFMLGTSFVHAMDEQDDLDNQNRVKTFFSQNNVELTDEFISEIYVESKKKGPRSFNTFAIPHMYYDAAFFFYNARRYVDELQPLEALF